MRQGDLIRFEAADYQEVRLKQQQAVADVASKLSKEKLFLGTHEHTITLGRRTDRRNLLAQEPSADLVTPKIYEIERGGDVTYHGPGQLVGYPIIRLGKNPDLHAYLRNLEEVLIIALRAIGIEAERKKDYTGVWVDGGKRKIASLGIAVKQWVTYHGFALNIATDLRYFQLLNPCGLDASIMTSVDKELGRTVELENLVKPLLQGCREILAIDFSPML
jgi:lipoate-protein ligase B